ncbi:putative damage-inducible protein DinB [Salirhabdus euzebyi]|uniref:Putative damage-inducible protein DinB n=1 Tax=Salirhabdus euzebyi TaxID=394506 RepID=A0A841Q634_9BACI|nr:DinB family protein [Salirhabdus euzebyi]MBB6453834.1 putative damage-inducible protein DinB [Salirhabdus euzebyi]
MTNINNLLNEFEQLTRWLESLKKMDAEKFFSPLAEGKWSVAALVSHFKSWDEYVLYNRVPLFNGEVAQGENGPDQEEVNENAKQYAHSGISQENLINEVIHTRKQFIQTLSELPEEAWSKNHQLNENKTITLEDYISGLISHDEHHQKQVAL